MGAGAGAGLFGRGGGIAFIGFIPPLLHSLTSDPHPLGRPLLGIMDFMVPSFPPVFVPIPRPCPYPTPRGGSHFSSAQVGLDKGLGRLSLRLNKHCHGEPTIALGGGGK